MGSRAVAALLLLLACAASVRAVQLRHVQKLSALPYCDEVHDRVDAIDMDEDQVEALQAWASAQTDSERARAQAKLGEKVGADGLAVLGLGPAMPSLAQLTLRTRKCQPRVDPADGITKNKNQVKANTNIKLQHLPQDFFAPDVSDNFFEDEWKKAEEEFQKGGPEDRVGALGKNKKKGPNGETVSDSLSAAEQKRLKEGKKLLSRKELLFQSKLLAEQRRLEEVRHKRFIGETKLQRERWQRIREQVTKTRLQTKRAEQRVKDAAAQLSTLGPIDRNWIPARNKQLAPASAVASSQVGWTYMFWLYVKERPKAWAQILHKGGDKRQRGPAIWIKPNQLGLHVRSATSKGWNTGVDTPHVKGLNLWTHVAITHSKSKLTIYFNGEVAIERALPPPLQNDAPLWSSAPFYEPAKVELADFKYMPSVASVALIQSIIARRAYFPAQQ